MYWRLRLAFVPTLRNADDVARLLDVALDADRSETERIVAVHHLRGGQGRRAIARALLPILDEPLAWLGSETHACIWALDDQLLVGVSRAGSIVACDEAPEHLTLDDDGQRHSATLGPAASIAHVGVLGERLSARPPWLVAPPHGGALFTVHERSRDNDDADAGKLVRRLYVGASHNLGVATTPFVSHWEVGPLLPVHTRKLVRLELRDGTLIAAVGRARRTTIAVGDVIDLAPLSLTLVHVTPPPPRTAGDVGDRAVHVDEDAIWLLRGEWPLASLRTLQAGALPTPPVDEGLPRTGSSVGHVVNLGGGDVGVVLPHAGDVRRVHVAMRSAVAFGDGLTLARGARGAHRLRA